MIRLGKGGHMENTREVDVAVVGGGIGGVYTAWRLLTSGSQNGLAGSWAKRAAA